MISISHESNFVTDTIGLVLHLEQRQSSAEANKLFQQAENEKAIIHIPAIVFAEILYLYQKGRIQTSLSSVSELLKQHTSFREYPLDLNVIQAAEKITSNSRSSTEIGHSFRKDFALKIDFQSRTAM